MEGTKLDRVALNNNLFALKGKIGRAKVHLVNALVKKIRKLKIILEKNENDERTKSKMESTLAEIQILKKLNLPKVSKDVMTDKSNPLETLKTAKTPEERAMARLFSHPIVVGAVKAIKDDLHLDAVEEDWRSYVVEVGQITKQRAKQAKRDARKKERTRRKEVIKRVIARNTKRGIVSVPPPKRKPLTKEDFVEKIESDVHEKIETTVKIEKPKPFITKTDDDTVHKEKPPKISHDRDSIREDRKTTKTKKVYQEPEVSNNDDEQVDDPFFVTDRGESYKASIKTNAIVHSDNEDNDKSDATYNRPSFKRLSDRTPQNNYQGNNRRDNNSTFNRRDNNTTFNRRDNFQNRQNDYNKPTEDLHPSWAAKKRQSAVQDFQGKKIKFDADGGEGRPDRNSQNDLGNGFRKNVEKTQEANLHPSWAAKMKQKPIVQEFKGNKITFDD